MKVEFSCNNKVIVFLNRKLIEGIDFSNKNDLEKYFKSLFNNLKKTYNIEIKGYYEIVVYIDKIYGIILEIEQVDEDLYYNQIDMRLCIINTIFLYQVEDIFNEYDIYRYKNKYYLKIDNIDYYELGRLIEQSNIVYKDTDIIISDGIKIEKM